MLIIFYKYYFEMYYNKIINLFLIKTYFLLFKFSLQIFKQN